eukprot:2150984-Pleurochrysis_carterae.AAC.1
MHNRRGKRLRGARQAKLRARTAGAGGCMQAAQLACPRVSVADYCAALPARSHIIRSKSHS